MNIEDYELYAQNFEYFQSMLKEGYELTLMPVKHKKTGGEYVALCTKKDHDIFPHAILVWDNPLESFEPLLIKGVSPDADSNPSPIITK